MRASPHRGFLYLVAITDWHTRKVLPWRISNTLEADFCIEALNEALHKFGPPEIMNTDRGRQFTSFAWTDHHSPAVQTYPGEQQLRPRCRRSLEESAARCMNGRSGEAAPRHLTI